MLNVYISLLWSGEKVSSNVRKPRICCICDFYAAEEMPRWITDQRVYLSSLLFSFNYAQMRDPQDKGLSEPTWRHQSTQLEGVAPFIMIKPLDQV